jgi:hypothetical protein
MSETETISKPFRASEEQSPAPDNSSILDKFNGLFSNKNAIIITLLFLLILLLVGINLLKIVGIILSDIADPLVPAFRSLLSMIGFTAGNIIKGSADVVANTSELGIDIAKGTTHSIGDILINSANPGIDTSKQTDLSDIIGVWNYPGSITEPTPVQSTEPTVTPISTQKPKAGWCYVGDFSGVKGCVEVTEHDKCMSGQIFASQAECLKPSQ